MVITKREFIAYSTAAIIIVLIIGVSFYFYSKNKSDKALAVRLAQNKAYVEQKRAEAVTAKTLAQAKKNLELAKAGLSNLLARSGAEQAVIAQIQSEYSNVSDTIIKKTDVMFQNPTTQNPAIKIKISNNKTKNDINQKRLQITQLLDSWSNTIAEINSDIPSVNPPPALPALVEKAKEDVALVQTYVDDLKNIVDALTPANSGLSQSEIDSYKAIVESVSNEAQKDVTKMDAIEKAAEKVEVTYADPNPPPLPSPGVPPENPQEPIEPTPITPPIVTPDEIKNQQDAVSQAQDEVTYQEQNQPPAGEPSGSTGSSDSSQNPPPQYSPFQNLDTSGWPDQAPNNSSDPSLIEGANKL